MKLPFFCRLFFALLAGVSLVLILLTPAGGCRTSAPLADDIADGPVATVPTVTSKDPGARETGAAEQPVADADPLDAGPPEASIPPAEVSPDPTPDVAGPGSVGDGRPAGPDAAGEGSADHRQRATPGAAGDDADEQPAAPGAPPGLDASLSGLADLDRGDLLPAAQPVSAVEAKLDGVLLELVRARRMDGEAGMRAYVERHHPGLSPDGLRVEIVSESPEDAVAVRDLVETAGGEVTTSFDNHVWAEVPLASVETLAEVAAVWTISLDQASFAPEGS